MSAIQRTINAEIDDLSEDDYVEIYHELRGYDESRNSYDVSLRTFAETVISSEYSHTLWYKWQQGALPLSRSMKSELRRAVGKRPLPPTVAEAVSVADPNAEVIDIAGGALIDRVVLTTRKSGVLDIQAAQVTSVTRPQRRARRKYVRPAVNPRYEALRARIGASWEQVIQAGLEALSK